MKRIARSLPCRRRLADHFSSRLSLCVSIAFIAGVAGFGCARNKPNADSAIRISGNIEVDEVRLAFKIPGRLQERLVDEGDPIAAGDLVARLEKIELTQELAVHRAERAAAAAVLAELKAGSRTQEIAASEASLESAEASRELARLEFDRQSELRATDAVAVRDFELARAQLQVAEARAIEAQQRLDLVREGPRPEAIAQAQARLAQADAVVERAQTQLANARLIAPLTGVVLEKHAEPGEVVAAGTPVVTVADTSHLWMRGYVNQTDLGRIRLGQAVEVRTDSFPDKTYEGRLAFIASEAEFTPKSVETHAERVTLVFRVRIELDNASGELKPGMAADATLATTAEN